MRAVTPFLALTAAMIVAAGCSGAPSSSTIPGGSASLPQTIGSSKHAHDGSCGSSSGGDVRSHTEGGKCLRAILIASLAYNPSTGTFTANGCDVDDATPYQPASSGPLAVATPVVVGERCILGVPTPSPIPSLVPSPSPSPSSPTTTPPTNPPPAAVRAHCGISCVPGYGMFIVGLPTGPTGFRGEYWGNVILPLNTMFVAGPALPLQTYWNFETRNPVNVLAGQTYVFYAVAMQIHLATPSPSPSPSPTSGTGGSTGGL